MMKNIIVFGAGDVGGLVYNLLGENIILCFADNYPNSETYMGLPLIGFNEFKELYEANAELSVIIASYDYQREISSKLLKHGITRTYVWPRSGAQQNLNEYSYMYVQDKLLDDYKVGDYKRIAVYCNDESWVLLLNLFSKRGYIDKIAYVIFDKEDYVNISIPASALVKHNLDEVMDDIDLLILFARRKESKIHDIVECNKMPFTIVDFNCYEKFIHSPELSVFKDRHKGDRCFIVGNGPSLKMEDLETLKKNKILSFGCNKIYIAFEDTSWRPDYYTVLDELIIKQCEEEITKMDIRYKFVVDICTMFWQQQHCDEVIKFHNKTEAFEPSMPEFSTDFSAYTAQGTTVTYTILQIAAYMGFSEMYLLGVDFTHPQDGDMRKGGNHFSAKYIAPNEVWNTPYPSKALLAYQKAELHSRLSGFRIFNATRGGKLEVFERVDFDGLF